MEYYGKLLSTTPLFLGLSAEETNALLPRLRPVTRQYARGSTVFAAGSQNREIGLVLAGEIEAVKHTPSGGQFTVSRMGAGGVFGDILAGSHTESPVTIRATGQSLVMFIPCSALLGASAAADENHRKVLANLVAVISDKYFALDARLELLLIHGIRRRLAAYLLRESVAHGSDAFQIPYDRASLAAHLGCERSALSREISAMAAEGLIQTRRSCFHLLNRPALEALFH